MNNHFSLLQASIDFSDFKFGLLTYVMAFVLTLIFIPPVIFMVKRFKLFDRPMQEKNIQYLHRHLVAFRSSQDDGVTFILVQIHNHPSIITFFLSMILLFGLELWMI
jgi:hypothetical protein